MKNIIRRSANFPTIAEDSSGYKSPKEIFETLEKYFRAIQINEISSQENENSFKKNLENSRKTLKMAEHILKNTHNPKLNILECDSYR